MIATHTLLINMVIGMCEKLDDWPHPLHDLGYAVKSIEGVLTTKNGERATPDLVAVSNKTQHALVIECKSGSGISAEQDRRYGDLEARSIAKEVGAGSFVNKHAVAYAINGESMEEMGRQTGHAIMAFWTSRIRGRGSFGERRLDAKLCCDIALEGMRPPTKYYSFGLYDDRFVMTTHIVQGMVALAKDGKMTGNLGDRETVEAIFGVLYRSRQTLASRHAKHLKAKIGEIINEDLATNGEMVRHVEELRKRNDAGAHKRFSVFCARYMQTVAAQRRLGEFSKA